MYWVAKLFTRLKSNWEFMEFNERKTIKNKYKTKQKLKDKIMEIKEEIEGSLIENCIYNMKKRLKEIIITKRDKIMY